MKDFGYVLCVLGIWWELIVLRKRLEELEKERER